MQSYMWKSNADVASWLVRLEPRCVVTRTRAGFALSYKHSILSGNWFARDLVVHIERNGGVAHLYGKFRFRPPIKIMLALFGVFWCAVFISFSYSILIGQTLPPNAGYRSPGWPGLLLLAAGAGALALLFWVGRVLARPVERRLVELMEDISVD